MKRVTLIIGMMLLMKSAAKGTIKVVKKLFKIKYYESEK